MGRKILREVTRTERWFDSPTVDIDLVELKVAAESARAHPFNSVFPGLLTIGLLPRLHHRQLA